MGLVSTSHPGGSLGNMSSLQNSLPGLGATGGLGSLMGTGGSMNGNSGMSASGGTTGHGSGGDSIGGQPYSGMQQQYQGLSSLLNPGKFDHDSNDIRHSNLFS